MLPYHQNLHHATHSFCFKNSLDGYQKLLSTETRWHDLYDLSNFKLFDKIQLQIKHRRFVPLQICPFVLKFGDFRKSNKALSGSGGPADPWIHWGAPTGHVCRLLAGRGGEGFLFNNICVANWLSSLSIHDIYIYSFRWAYFFIHMSHVSISVQAFRIPSHNIFMSLRRMGSRNRVGAWRSTVERIEQRWNG